MHLHHIVEDHDEGPHSHPTERRTVKQFDIPMNSVALDLALQVLFTSEGRDKAKVAYDLLNTTLGSVYQAGSASRDAELVQARDEYNEAFAARSLAHTETIKGAERIGYDKGHAAAMFAQAAEALNKEAGEIDLCLLPQECPPAQLYKAPESETAFVRNAVSALG